MLEVSAKGQSAYDSGTLEHALDESKAVSCGPGRKISAASLNRTGIPSCRTSAMRQPSPERPALFPVYLIYIDELNQRPPPAGIEAGSAVLFPDELGGNR
jgi:hypothetical protein